MKHDLILIRVEPVTRTIVPMRLRIGRDATRKMRQMLGAKSNEQIGWRQLLDVENVPLIAAGLLDREDGVPTWRLQGASEDHSGIGMLFGRGPGGGMVDAPVSREWVERRIVWGDGVPA